MAAIRNPDGRLEVFVRCDNSSIHHRWQLQAGGNWSSWEELGRVSAGSAPSVGVWRGASQQADVPWSGSVVVCLVGTDGDAWWTTRTPRGWSRWRSRGGQFNSDCPPSLISDRFAAMQEMYVVGQDGVLWRATEDAAGAWSDFVPEAKDIAGSVGGTYDVDGPTRLFAVTTEHVLVQTTMDRASINHPKRKFGPFSYLDGPAGDQLLAAAAAPPSVIPCADGRIEGVFLRPDGAVGHLWQSSPAGPVVIGGDMGGTASSAPVLARHSDDRLEMFWTDREGVVWHNWQTAPSNGWHGPEPLPGMTAVRAGSRLVAAANADGRLEVFGVTTSGNLVHAWQHQPSTDPWYGDTLATPGHGFVIDSLGLAETDFGGVR